jgi:hypothetical protein
MRHGRQVSTGTRIEDQTGAKGQGRASGEISRSRRGRSPPFHWRPVGVERRRRTGRPSPRRAARPPHRPSRPGVDARSCLEAQDGLARHRRPEPDDPPAQAGARARLPVLGGELAQEDSRPEVRTRGQAPLDVSDLGRRELGPSRPGRVSGRRIGLRSCAAWPCLGRFREAPTNPRRSPSRRWPDPAKVRGSSLVEAFRPFRVSARGLSIEGAEVPPRSRLASPLSED